MKALTLYIESLKGLLKIYHQDDTSLKPELINRAKLVARAVVIISLFSKDKGETVIDVCSAARWLEEATGGNCVIAELIINLSTQEKQIINYNIDDLELTDMSDIYEQMLSVDTIGFEIVDGKELRNQLGSYYSPKELVSCLTQKSIDYYVKTNGVKSLESARIVDFSCGAGAFLISAVKTILSYLPNVHIDTIISNLYACDVDLIALELAKLNILELNGNLSNYAILSEHFYHANFLVHDGTSNPMSVNKIQLSMDGFIYHPSLAVGYDFLKEYDIILGNPPWEKIRFEEKKFYAQFSQEVLQTNFKFDLATSIKASEKSNAGIKKYVDSFRTNLELCKKQIKGSKYFVDSSAGELNSSTLFADSCFQQMSKNGVVGIIIKSSSILSPVNKKFFKKIKNNIIAVFDFINTNKYFEIDSRERYCFLIIGNKKEQQAFRVGMNLKSVSDIETSCLNVSNSDLSILNPETEMLPNIISPLDLELVLKIYRKHKTIGQIYPRLKYGRIVHFTTHVKDLDKVSQPDNIPVYEGKFFSSFDGMYSGFNYVKNEDRYKSKASTMQLSPEDKANGVKPLSRFYIKENKWISLSHNYQAEYMLAWHSLTSSSNGRACVATILPFIPASQSVQFLITNRKEELIYLACLFNSTIFDFVVKNKLTGIDLTQTIVKQIPIPYLFHEKNKDSDKVYNILLNICYTFLSTDDRMKNLWNGYNVNLIETKSREDLFVMLDSIVGALYGLNNKEMEYIASKYPSLYTQERIQLLLNYFSAIS